MLNKKMLLSILIIGCIATVTSAGTWAYFSDAASTNGNSVAAGDLKFNDAGIASATKSVSNAQPGDTAVSMGTIPVTNDGSLTGLVSVTASDAAGIGMTDHMIIYINNQAVFDRGNYYTVPLGQINAHGTIYPEVKYSFVDDGSDQNNAQAQTFNFDLDFSLSQDSTTFRV